MEKQPLWWCLLAGLFAALWAALASTESLWVDELHSSWTVSSTLADVASRARQGNQSPLYFWGLFGFVRTLSFFSPISAEFALRLPSILGWGATVAVCVHMVALRSVKAGQPSPLAERKATQGVLLVALLAWLWLDRNLLFYASEARVYAAVQLLSLLAWCSIARLIAPERSSPRTVQRYIVAWSVLAIFLIFLHVTSVLAVFWQCVVGTTRVWRRGDLTERKQWLSAVLAVGLAAAIAVVLSQNVWEQRSQWRVFAGDASLHKLLGMFPVLALGTPVLTARVIDSWFGSRHAIQRSFGIASGLWWIAAFGPWITAWAITALDVAPLLHRRFVIVSAIPLTLLAIAELSQVRRPELKVWAALVVGGWLLVGQGTLANWRDGYIIGWQRVEGWREATEYLNKELHPSDGVWCASGLIEGDNAQLPLAPELNRYLSFPLRGAYRVSASERPFIEPEALVGDWNRWPEQLSPSQGRSLWIVFRGNPTAFKEKLRRLRQQDTKWHNEEPRAFGLVSVVRLTEQPAP